MGKIIVIVGPTAVGKTDLSVNLAQKFNGEIVSADSRQVYKGMDIGTGKVTKKEMRGIPHYLIDVISPKKQFTVTEYKKKAERAIEDIIKRGKLPIIVGGTGFYIQALVDNIDMPDVPPNKILRNKLEKMNTEKLNALLKKKDPRRYEEIEEHDRTRIIRAIEIAEFLGKVPKATKSKPLYNPLIIGLDIPKEELEEKIETRLLKRLRAGMMAEIKRLHENGVSWKRMEALGLEYKYGAQFVKGELSKDEFIKTLSTKIKQYAKRQRTWFKRDKRIQWFKPVEGEKITKLVEKFIFALEPKN